MEEKTVWLSYVYFVLIPETPLFYPVPLPLFAPSS